MFAHRQSNGLLQGCGLLLMAVIGLSVLSPKATAAEPAPKLSAGSAGEAVANWAAAIDAGDIDKARAFVDQGKDGTFAHYVGEIASMHRFQSEIVAQVRKSFGDAAAAKADKLMRDRADGVLAMSFMPSADTLATMKEGSRFYAPGFKTECVVSRRDGKWMIDGTEVLSGGLNYIFQEEFAAHRKKLAAESKAALEAHSGEEFLKTIAKINGVE